jgi:DNA ligase-associated metallophosphoesterase
MQVLELVWNNQHFTLHGYGAMYWREQDAILLADVHLGKSAHFRKNGLAVPTQADSREYDKLQEVIDYFAPSRIWFLGDLFHSYKNTEWHFFENWVRSQEVEMTLIMGNHDVISKNDFERIGVRTCMHLQMGNIYLTHHPDEQSGYHNIAGHVHPAVRLMGKGRQQIKMRCFQFKKSSVLLPSFGDFTGSYVITPGREDQIVVLSGGEILKI